MHWRSKRAALAPPPPNHPTKNPTLQIFKSILTLTLCTLTFAPLDACPHPTLGVWGVCLLVCLPQTPDRSPPLASGLADPQEPEPEVYGYYGRTASPPPASTATGPGAWAATPAPQYSVDNNNDNDNDNGREGTVGVSANVGEAQAQAEKSGAGAGAGVDGAEEFVPDFAVPEGVVAPSTVRQHMMMVGTARTTVRSPQVGAEGAVGAVGATLCRCCGTVVR